MSPLLVAAFGAAVGTGVALVFWRRPVLAFAQRAAAFVGNVRAELRKVSWPGWTDLRRSTMVVTIFLIIIGIIIGLMDLVFSRVLIGWLGQAFR